MNSPAENNSENKFIYTVVMTVLLSAAGFAFLHFNLSGYGITFFILIPLLIGYYLPQQPGFKSSFIFSLFIGMVAFFYLLISAQLEGLFCVITLFPLMFILVLIGSLVGWLIRKQFKSNDRGSTLKITLTPLIILGIVGAAEHYYAQKYDYYEVESRVYLPYSRELVFDYIKSVDTLDAEKPLLLNLGLAVPQKCILEKEETGAARICYFAEGTIDEKVKEIERGRILKMDVTRYGLPGRKWLKFLEASYLFEKSDSGTILRRITSYRTELKPRWYWKFWEVKAIEAEHKYVLDDLRNRLDRGRP